MKSIFVIVPVVILLVALGPLFFIWSLNTLFPAVSIQYTVETWIASFIILMVFGKAVK